MQEYKPILQLLSNLCDFLPLLFHALHGKTVRNPKALRMVGYRQEGVSLPDSSFDHFLDRVLAIAPRCVGVQLTLEILYFN